MSDESDNAMRQLKMRANALDQGAIGRIAIDLARRPVPVNDPVIDLARPPTTDLVNHPKHYTAHPSGVECIQVTEHFNFNRGNAMKYIWRAGEKAYPGDDPLDTEIRDLEKARWYLDREIARLKGK